jgi:hypothetical protein
MLDKKSRILGITTQAAALVRGVFLHECLLYLPVVIHW